ncbi:MAG: outer membrane protein assembly factor BamD [Fidelibacterota bacterium]|nr:MAG: outer membrane protein assembly factor BamD [Candidatus Neomarinimicrobiota bacterium]
MKQGRILLFLGVLSIALLSCAGRKDGSRDNIDMRFNRGMVLFEKGKWVRAADDFNWVVLNNPAGNLAAEAQYLYAECQYQQKLYVEAQIEFERLLRRWASTEHLIDARYRIVQCLVAQSPGFHYDQKATLEAIDELQAFIDDFPDSPQRTEAEGLITDLRIKIARKHYESGRLYLKWDRPSPARLYFDVVLSQYYDTAYADEARVGIVISYILEEDLEAAHSYLGQNGAKFANEESRSEAASYIEMAEQGKFDLSFYIRLYK